MIDVVLIYDILLTFENVSVFLQDRKITHIFIPALMLSNISILVIGPLKSMVNYYYRNPIPYRLCDPRGIHSYFHSRLLSSIIQRFDTV